MSEVNQTIKERIRNLRAKMLVHSYIYYELNDSIVSDDTWQKWANELAEIQNNNPSECKIDFYDWEFVGWDGTTGHHLPYKTPWSRAVCDRILKYHYANQKN